MHRLKSLTGPGIRARLLENQIAEMSVKMFVLNEMMALKS